MPAKENQKDRVLTEEEIQIFWREIEGSSMSELTRLCLQLQLVTAQRKGEIVITEWVDMDLNTGWWTIPAKKAKNKLSHRVPLSPLAMQLLERVKALSGSSKWLFPSTQTENAMLNTSIDHALRRNQSRFGIPTFTPHDLRRTAASHMTGLGISRLTVSKILNHVESGITAVYDRHSYDQEKRDALNLWAEKIASIIT